MNGNFCAPLRPENNLLEVELTANGAEEVVMLEDVRCLQTPHCFSNVTSVSWNGIRMTIQTMSKEKFELYGESLRELGVLLLLFVPLETLLHNDSRYWLRALLGGVWLVIIGVEIESKGVDHASGVGDVWRRVYKFSSS